MSLTGLKRFFSWKKAYAIIFAKFQVISSHFDKLPYFTPDFPTNQIMDWDLDKGEILKTYKNEFDWLKRFFSWKKAYAIIFAKFQVIYSHFDKLPYFTPDFPTNQIMDWDLDKGEILKTYKNEFDWLKTIFFMKKGIRDHFCKVSNDLKPFWQVTIFHTRLPHKPNHGLGLRQMWNSENLQKWVWMAQTIFFMKKGIRDHFCKVSSDLKPFWQVTIFHTRLPHKPNHGLGLRQGWNSENLQKWLWMAQNDISHERRHTRSFLQSFKWFKAILTSYHISHQTSPQTKSWIGT